MKLKALGPLRKRKNGRRVEVKIGEGGSAVGGEDGGGKEVGAQVGGGVGNGVEAPIDGDDTAKKQNFRCSFGGTNHLRIFERLFSRKS